ncbi:hypothetical protein [Haloarcula sp. JP-L23]|uniref:DUF7553 family protein n=1 Tax=Haloarcula sp. JP-L23 TaxID=2716717 RepID=UPI00140F2B67|nr:hypothetical protein G9465_17320 [Haloarcula sp. JP-L23]
MCRRFIRRANRAVLRAIEAPPDSGVEDRLDEVAARLWYLAEAHPEPPDPGQVSRLRATLMELEERVADHRAARLADARHCLAAYGRHLDPV